MFASRDVCINFRKKTCAVDLIYIAYKFTRHLNGECFELAVPAYAPTFFVRNPATSSLLSQTFLILVFSRTTGPNSTKLLG